MLCANNLITHLEPIFHDHFTPTIWVFNIAMENPNFFIGKPSIKGPFSMAVLNKQRVTDMIPPSGASPLRSLPWQRQTSTR